MQAWIEDELRTVNLADERLNKRYRVLLERFSDKPTLSIPAACTGWPETQAAYRFCDNERVTPEQLLQPHYDATLERIRQYPVVLIPQDTTQFDLTRQQEKIGGPLGDEKHWGLHDHVALAVTPERLALGVVHSFTWARNLEDFHKRNEALQADRRKRKLPVVGGLPEGVCDCGGSPQDENHLPLGQRR